MGFILEAIGEFLCWVIFDVCITMTGECVLYVVTLGRHEIRWDLYAGESATKFAIFSERSFWVGMTFWIATIVLVYHLLS